MVAETIISALGGGLLRVVPEFLKWLDRKDERKHELAMQDKAFKFEELRGSQKMGEMNAENQQILDKGGLEALVESIKGQDAPSGVKWIDGISKLVRPILTFYWCIFGITVAKWAQYHIFTVDKGMTWAEATNLLWGPDELAIVAGMINFWFLDRVIRHNNRQIR